MHKDNYGWNSLIQWTAIIMDELHWFNGQRLLWMNFIESMDKDNYGWTQNVNVARFARNVEWDFFYDFQTLWGLLDFDDI